jgi:hypothetical protein
LPCLVQSATDHVPVMNTVGVHPRWGRTARFRARISLVGLVPVLSVCLVALVFVGSFGIGRLTRPAKVIRVEGPVSLPVVPVTATVPARLANAAALQPTLVPPAPPRPRPAPRPQRSSAPVTSAPARSATSSAPVVTQTTPASAPVHEAPAPAPVAPVRPAPAPRAPAPAPSGGGHSSSGGGGGGGTFESSG